jgi:NDP-sugar pyrophosphorylase family protein
MTPPAVIVALDAPARAALGAQLDWLREAKVTQAVVCLSGDAASARRKFSDGAALGMKLRYFVEPAVLGTAGCVKALGAASLPDDVLIVAGAPESPAAPLLAAHEKSGGFATLGAHACRHEPACDPVVIGPENRVVELPGRPLVGRFPLGLSPFWVVKRALMRLVPEGKPFDFARDLFPAALRAGEPLAAWKAS